MSKRVAICVVSAIIILLGVVVNSNDKSQNINNFNSLESSYKTNTIEVKDKPTCDGTTVTYSCELDDINYLTYIYHPAVPEISHPETVTTYRKEVTSYCTLCSDGTYSPSCATGRGACSHHGWVAQWNAPIYRNIPEYSTKTVIDTPGQEAYYEKVPE